MDQLPTSTDLNWLIGWSARNVWWRQIQNFVSGTVVLWLHWPRKDLRISIHVSYRWWPVFVGHASIALFHWVWLESFCWHGRIYQQDLLLEVMDWHYSNWTGNAFSTGKRKPWNAANLFSGVLRRRDPAIKTARSCLDFQFYLGLL